MAHLRPRPSRVPRRRAKLGFLVAVFLLTLAGCGDDTTPTSGDATGDDPSAPSGSATTEGTEPAEPATSEATSETTSETTEAVPSSEPADEGLEGRLLTADELPGVNDQTVWKVEATGPEDGATTGTCQRFDLVSVGADEAVRRTFTSNQDTVEAEQVVAEFADAKSAWRAHQVLKTWRAKCADQIKADQVDVGDLRTLKVSEGFADSYVVRYGDAGAESQHWDGTGISRRGAFLSLVEIDQVGQDYLYPAGEDPASLAAMSALGQLG